MNRSLLKAEMVAKQFRALRAVAAPGSIRSGVALALSEGVEKDKRPPIFAKAADGEIGELFIYDSIGFDCFAETGGITSNKVKDALAEMKNVKTLNVFINSPGGDVFEAKSIYTQLLRFAAEKVVYVDGIAASAATLIAMSGDRIITSAVGTWMVHEAWSGAMGNAADMRAIADVLDLESQIIADTYAKQTGKTPAEMRELMLAETWMNAEQALEHGFTDEISHDEAETEEGDEEADARNSRSSFAVAAAVTQSRIKSVAQLLSARAEMHHRNHPGQPGAKRPASR